MPRIRRFHTALGAFFASRGEWKGEPRGAVFQLERMREATRQLNAGAPENDFVRDPAELLQQLVVGYCRSGAIAKAAELAKQIAFERRRTGSPIDSGVECR